jgi:hypothetical protein
LPETGPALRIVITLINTWQINMLAARSKFRHQTITIVEEGWHVAEGHIGEVFRRNTKLSRGYGLATLCGFHHIADFPATSPARALLQEAETVFIYRQGRLPDAQACVDLWNLPAGSVETIMNLKQGQFLLKIGSQRPIMVNHLRSSHEIELTDTDAAVIGGF